MHVMGLLCAGPSDNLGLLHLRPFSGVENRLAAGKDLPPLLMGLLLHLCTAGCVLIVFVTVSLTVYQSVWNLQLVHIHMRVRAANAAWCPHLKSVQNSVLL